MSQVYREAAARLIRESIDSETGQLNMTLLSRRSTAWANEQAERHPRYGEAVASRTVNDLQNYFVDRLTIGTREVLGLIPRSQWTPRFDGDEMSRAVRTANANTPEPNYDTGLVLNPDHHMTVREAMNPRTTMRENNVTPHLHGR